MKRLKSNNILLFRLDDRNHQYVFPGIAVSLRMRFPLIIVRVFRIRFPRYPEMLAVDIDRRDIVRFSEDFYGFFLFLELVAFRLVYVPGYIYYRKFRIFYLPQVDYDPEIFQSGRLHEPAMSVVPLVSVVIRFHAQGLDNG